MMRTTQAEAAREDLRQYADTTDALHLQRFFKTGPGEYGAGDRFLGVRVPAIRRVAREHRDLILGDAMDLLHSPFHEERLLSLLILAKQFGKATPDDQRDIYRLYLGHTYRINNWDLVDASAEHIVGAYLLNRSRRPLYQLAKSPLLWDRRIAIMATFHFIKRGDFAETLALAEKLLADKEDLIHKAVGWMLREVGNRDLETERAFLNRHYRNMPRTMLRYAIEKFPEPMRQAYLKGTV